MLADVARAEHAEREGPERPRGRREVAVGPGGRRLRRAQPAKDPRWRRNETRLDLGMEKGCEIPDLGRFD